MNDLLLLLEPEDLTLDMRIIADSCGMEVAISLLKNLAGGRYYIPHPTSLDKLMERYVSKDAKNTDVRVIAARLGVTEGCIRKYLSRTRVER